MDETDPDDFVWSSGGDFKPLAAIFYDPKVPRWPTRLWRKIRRRGPFAIIVYFGGES